MLDIVLSADGVQPASKLTFEHSLVSISKWEQEHQKPFYGREPKTAEETESYIRYMLLTPDPPLNFFKRFSIEQYQQVADYINSKATATTFGLEPEQRGRGETITSELVYFWLVQFNIPFLPTETWHINRVMTLIKIAGIKNSKPKKMSAQQRAEQFRALNEHRRRETGSAG